MTLRRTSLASALLLALASVSASAAEVRIDDFTILGPSGLSVTVAGLPGANWYGAAGQFSGTLDGASFATYCVDLQQYTSFDVTYSDYRYVSGEAAFGAKKADDLARLLTYVGMSPKYSTDSAMVQAAVWEVVYERGRNYDFNGGKVVITGLDASTQDWLNDLDWKAVRDTAPMLDIGAVVSANHQDFVVTTPIPEPSTYALMIGGLAAVGFVSRRRMKRD